MGLPKTGCGYDAIYTFVDKLTKYVHLIPTVSTVTAEGVAQLYVNHVFSMHSLSQVDYFRQRPSFQCSIFPGVSVTAWLTPEDEHSKSSRNRRTNRTYEPNCRGYPAYFC